MNATDSDVVIIGAGASGLTCALMLKRRGINSTVLERSRTVGESWASRPDGLRLTGGKRASRLPGCPFPPTANRFPSRDEFCSYLRSYARHHSLNVETDVRVDRLRPNGGGWDVHATGRVLTARHVVVATGLFGEPFLPAWALAGRRETQANTRAPGQPAVLHSSDYRNPKPFKEKDVLIVGAGTTGLEIAAELAGSLATRIRVAIRTPPNLIPRLLGLLPGVKLILKMPPGIGDAQMALLRKTVIGDLSAWGLPVPAVGPFANLRLRHTTPTMIGPEAVAGIRTGRIEPVAAVESIQDGQVSLVDGSQLEVDAVIAATGFRPGLESLLDGLDVLNGWGEPRRDGLPGGLHFSGFELVPGQLAFAGDSARRVALEIAADEGVRPGTTGL